MLYHFCVNHEFCLMVIPIMPIAHVHIQFDRTLTLV